MPRLSAPALPHPAVRWTARSAIAAGVLMVSGCGVETSAPDSQPSSAGSQPSSPSAEPRGPREFTVNVSGDLLWHDDLWDSARMDAATAGQTGADALDFDPQLASIREYVSSADLAICHAEVPYAEEGGPYGSYPLFAAPPQIAATLAQTGFDVCTTASNHTLDAGWDGLVRSLDVHESAGIKTVGSYRSQQDAEESFLQTVETEAGPVTVGIVSQTFSLNGVPVPADREWSVGMLDAGRAVEQARQAREAGADVVLVHLHAGDEYQTEPNAEQLAFVEEVTASGEADLVFGQHAHWVQPADRVNDTWVVYGAGNLMAHHELGRPGTYEGALFQFTFTEIGGSAADTAGDFEVSDAEYAPTLITPHHGGQPARLLLIPAERADHPELAATMDAAAERTREAVYRHGVEGLREVGSP
ncbi:CapA family protein [Microbacterium sp. A93]|uniref:CapA family protein n=1 Tax=Microbacterium sp. A93 TaxID=3450716 RepID=UPI003F42FAB9